jgi:hypothetical protein
MRTLILRGVLASTVMVAGLVQPCLAADTSPGLCIGTNIRIGTFRLRLIPPQGGTFLAVDSVNVIQPGDDLEYQPVQLPPGIRKRARIALVIVPAPEAKHKELEVLPARPANAQADWLIPTRASVLGIVFGPQGLNVKKVSSLINKDPDLIPQLAAYAQQTATVNALVETLSQYDKSQPGTEDLNSVLSGFSSQYNVALPQIDPKAPPDQQAALLLRGVMPSVSIYDPLGPQQSAVVQQSAGLAGAVATLFYGTPVGLAAGGAQLFENLRLMMFPGTDFRAAFIQPAGNGGMKLCSNSKPPAPRTRVALLWMLRVPDASPPAVSLAQLVDLPISSTATVHVSCPTHAELALLPHARGWQLVSSQKSIPVPVKVTVGPSQDTLTLDLSHAQVPADAYHLVALWDWSPLKVSGTLHLRLFSNFAGVRLTPDSQDLLVQGTGPVSVKLIGADFEFVNKVAIVKAGGPRADAWPLYFTLPKGRNGGDQLSMTAQVDTSLLSAGNYELLLTQSDDKTESVPVDVHPPDPKLDDLPLRANSGLKQQTILLRGTSLERVEGITSRKATWSLAPLAPGSAKVTERQATISLKPGVHVGDLLSASMQVEGLEKPIEISDILQVAGPLPAIVGVKESFPSNENVALRPQELPAGATVSFALRAENLGSQPAIALACSNRAATLQTLELHPGERTETAQLDSAGEGILFLILQPGAVGRSGCVLTAAAANPDTGTSVPYALGTIIRLPRIDKFTLTDQKAADGLYTGSLTGRDLQMIVQTGWNNHNGYPVQGIPTPVPGSPQEQTLEIEMLWPPPSPNAPVYIWLLGENQGRKTSATY